jgi:hypothetical protein
MEKRNQFLPELKESRLTLCFGITTDQTENEVTELKKGTAPYEVT